MAQTPLAAPHARQPYGVPKHPTDPLVLPPSPRHIRFCHPGYPDSHCSLFFLPALDRPSGVHHGLALDACAIVADNRWDGYFTLDREGVQRVPTDDMDLSLQADVYYFHVPGGSDYPVVPIFAEWRFPHDNLPARWRRDPNFDAITSRCQLSKAGSLLEDAHIIPQNQADAKWFDQNGMSRYGSIQSNANTIKFKVDVHQHFDRKPKFAIVPKYNTVVAHMVTAQTIEAREAIELYHNVPVTLYEQSSHFLLARLAWTIFPLLEGFLLMGKDRRLLRQTGQGRVVREEDAEGCTRAWLAGRPRSASPSKRLRGGFEGMQDAYDSEFLDDSDWEEEERGRKRTRRSFHHDPLHSQSAGGDLLGSSSDISESRDAKLLENLKS